VLDRGLVARVVVIDGLGRRRIVSRLGLASRLELAVRGLELSELSKVETR
jgi:hypothetical protein